jgi:hypothetical protein
MASDTYFYCAGYSRGLKESFNLNQEEEKVLECQGRYRKPEQATDYCMMMMMMMMMMRRRRRR